MPAADVPTGFFNQGCLMRKQVKEYGRMQGPHRKVGSVGQSYLFTIEMKGGAEGSTDFRKECLIGMRKLYFFCFHSGRSHLKHSIWRWRGYELGHHSTMKGLNGEFITGCRKNIVQEIRGRRWKNRDLSVFFSCFGNLRKK